MIWFENVTIDGLNDIAAQDNILKHLGIRFTAVTDDSLSARMPIDHRTHQPYGILHGGATCVLTESLGSFASLLVVDRTQFFAVGSVITTNHLRPVSNGFVTGVCKPLHIGRTKHVWTIDVFDDNQKLVARTELTCAVTPAERHAKA